MNITKIGLDKTIFVRLLFILIVLIGIYCYESMPKFLDPDLNFNQAFINTVHKNLASEDVEKFITTPLEDEIKDIDGIKKIFSHSSANHSTIILEFEDNIKDMKLVVQELRNKVDQIRTFPEDTEKPVIEDLDTAFFPICMIALGGELTTDRLYQAAEKVAEKIEELPGIAKVVILGKRDRRVIVKVDPVKMESYGITLPQIVNEIRNRNQNFKAGYITIGQQKLGLRVLGKYSDTNDFLNLIFLREEKGGSVFLRDFATVETDHEDPETLTLLNGKPGVVMQVKRKKDTNVIQNVSNIKEILKKEKQSSSSPLEITLFNDTSLEIRQRITVLQKNAGLGMILVFTSLSFFLGIRQATFAFVGIPISFFVTFIFMKLFGLSINGVSLFALIIVLGMIVDDAIIVLENVNRHLEKPYASTRDAVVKGVKEVQAPIISAVLTSMAAFAPIFLVSGIMGKFIAVIPKVVIFALSASLFEVLFMMPSHILEFSKTSKNKKKQRVVNSDTMSRTLLTFLKRNYFKVLKISIRWRYLVTVAFIVCLVATVSLIPRIGIQLFPANDAFPRFDIKVWLPVGSNLDATMAKLEEVASSIRKPVGSDLDSLISVAGFVEVEYRITHHEHVGTIHVVLSPAEERQRSIQESIQKVRDTLSEISGIQEFMIDRIKEGPPTGPPVQVRVLGENWSEMENAANLLVEKLNTINGTVDIRSNFSQDAKEGQLTLKQEEAKKFGITMKELSNTLITAFNGVKASVFHEEGEEIDVYVRLKQTSRENFNSVLDLNIPTKDGKNIPLKEIAEIKIGSSLIRINHYNGKREIVVSSEIENEKVTSNSVNISLKEFVENDLQPAYPTLQFHFGGEYEETQKSIKEVILSLSLAIFLIFVILATQFNSFFQPFMIMLAIPFGTIGVVTGLMVSGSYFTFAGMLGVVGLTGVIVNDSIILLSFVNDLRKDKESNPYYPVMKAALTRFRPIMLTTVTTVFGMFPMAIGIGGKSPLWAPLANAFMWGISFSTVLILILIPCVYLIMEDIKMFSKNFFFARKIFFKC